MTEYEPPIENADPHYSVGAGDPEQTPAPTDDEIADREQRAKDAWTFPGASRPLDEAPLTPAPQTPEAATPAVPPAETNPTQE